MKFWLPISAVVALLALYPYLRFIFKRIISMKKIKRLCLERGYRIHETGRFTIFSTNRAKGCDFYIETEKEIYAIKLFGVLRRRCSLVIKENGDYFIRGYIVILSYAANLNFPVDRRLKHMPEYDFEYKYNGECQKPLKRVLLLNPICTSLLCESKNGWRAGLSGDEISGKMRLYTVNSFIESIK